MKLTLTHTTTEVISGRGFKVLTYVGEGINVTIKAAGIPSSVDCQLFNPAIPTHDQMLAVMSEMGRRSGLKPKAGRFGTLGESRQREVATAGGRASAAARIARKLTEAV